ncbi:MAG: hypothetical protein QW314_05810 [Thermoproteota archaeon]|nr:hypothetical protein [Candidatus Brockarchaeota archaeon]
MTQEQKELKCFKAVFEINKEEVSIIFYSTHEKLEETLKKIKLKLDVYNQTNCKIIACKEYDGSAYDFYWPRKLIESF